jgi:homocysteine S-methyltransferase
MGTYLSARHNIDIQECELINLRHPEYVRETHALYLKAGADAIKTNTFNAYAFGAEWVDIIKAGCKIAREAARGSSADIYASLGPVDLPDTRSIINAYEDMAAVFLREGVNRFLFETFAESDILTKIAEAVKRLSPEAFIIAECSIMPDGYTRRGVSAKTAAEDLSSSMFIDAYGFNCSCGPAHLLNIVKALELPSKPFCVMPNAGYPDIQGGRTMFDASPGYFAKKLLEIANCGASIIGGCCGATPEHIKQTHDLLVKAGSRKGYPAKAAVRTAKFDTAEKDPILWKKGVIAVELDSPPDGNIGPFLSRARKLTEAGADLLTIADCPVGRARLDSSMLAAKLRRELCIETLPHLTCRDRNLNATKALLMGLYAEGVGQVLAVTGDPIPTSSRDEIKSVFNFNAINLAAFINDLNGGIFAERPLIISAALNVNASNFDAELSKARRKEKNGVTAFLTQPVFTEAAVNNLKRASDKLSAKILAGIMPVVSYRNACFINNEVAGITIPDDILRMYESVRKDEALRLAVSVSMRIAAEVSGDADGYYIITPLNKADIVCEIISGIRRGFI